MITSEAGRSWLRHMPDSVSEQRRLLEALLDAVEADERWRWLELSCSLSRGAGDRWSDIDAGLGARDDDYDDLVVAMPQLLGSLGTIVALLDHDLGWTAQHRRFFVQYDVVQLDLVVVLASSRPGLPPDSVALLDRDGALAKPWTPGVWTADDTARREWAFLGWVALANLAKYLNRGSLWEAHAQLEAARTEVWRLWAAARDVPYPVFGHTSVLDQPESGAPPGIEATVVPLDAAAIRAASDLLADLLDRLGVDDPQTRSMAMWTRRALAQPPEE